MTAYEGRQAVVAASSILRVDKRRGAWEAIPAALIRDRRLELDALGLAVWLLSMPDAWEIRVTALPRLLKSTTTAKRFGRERLRRMLRELEHAGYLARMKCRRDNGRYVWRSVLSATPFTMDGSATGGSATDGSATGGKPVDYLQTVSISDFKNPNLNQSRAEADSEKTGLAKRPGSRNGRMPVPAG